MSDIPWIVKWAIFDILKRPKTHWTSALNNHRHNANNPTEDTFSGVLFTVLSNNQNFNRETRFITIKDNDQKLKIPGREAIDPPKKINFLEKRTLTPFGLKQELSWQLPFSLVLFHSCSIFPFLQLHLIQLAKFNRSRLISDVIKSCSKQCFQISPGGTGNTFSSEEQS